MHLEAAACSIIDAVFANAVTKEETVLARAGQDKENGRQREGDVLIAVDRSADCFWSQ
jgi:hypothetical protein